MSNLSPTRPANNINFAATPLRRSGLRILSADIMKFPWYGAKERHGRTA